VEKFCIARQAKDDNMVHVHCMLDTYSYKHTLRICNTDCFFPASVVTQMCLNVNVTRTLIVLFKKCHVHNSYLWKGMKRECEQMCTMGIG
jgi:hypothetical protein